MARRRREPTHPRVIQAWIKEQLEQDRDKFHREFQVLRDVPGEFRGQPLTGRRMGDQPAIHGPKEGEN